LSFLEPQINPFGQWAEPSTDLPPTSKHDPRLWTLDERRALLLYTRALQVHRKQDPDWSFVGTRLNRAPNECKFISRYLVSNWLAHHGLTHMQKTDAGVTADELLASISKIKVNEGTRTWLRRLTTAPEPALRHTVAVTRKRWTRELERQLLLECPITAVAVRDGMQEYCRESGRTISSVCQHLAKLRAQHTKQAPPLDEAERAVIADAARALYPQPVRWKHIADKLPTRSFFDVSDQIRITP
ncbi:hypothetical protein IWW50_004624, partial [Coemansia erecta]